MSNASQPQVYHERQSKQLCALHVLNNLFQERAFTKADMDDICLQLAPDSSSWWNPHRSPIGLGNYDINVIMAALQIKDQQAVWFDKRKNLDDLIPRTALGFILNVPSGSRLTSWMPSALVSQKHWIAIRRIGDDLYFNLDSHLYEPEIIGDDVALLGYLKSEMSKGDRELIIVVPSDSTAESDLWKS